MISFFLCVLTYPFLFFFNDTATTEIYTLSLHDALPISPGPLHLPRRRRVARQLLNPLQELLAPGDGVEHRACVLILTREKRQPLRILVVLHPAVGVAQGFPEIGVLDDRDPRHRRRRDARGGGRAAAHQPGREHASGTDEQVATIESAHHLPPGIGVSARPPASARRAASARRGRRGHPRRASAPRCCPAPRARSRRSCPPRGRRGAGAAARGAG